MQCVLPNTILKKCPSKHAAMCPSKHELCVLPNMKLELRNKGLTSSETYPYPKGEHIGAKGPKYASLINFGSKFDENRYNLSKIDVF